MLKRMFDKDNTETKFRGFLSFSHDGTNIFYYCFYIFIERFSTK